MTSSQRSITQIPTTSAATPRSFGRVAPLVLACGLILAGAVAMFRRSEPPVSESEVVRRIWAAALHRTDYPGMDDGGPVGPWWVAAAEADHLEGVLQQFRLSGVSIELTAREARVIVDPVTDGVSFELNGVVFAVLPENIEPSAVDADGVLTTLDYYVLGPVTWRTDIVPDAEAPLLSVHD